MLLPRDVGPLARVFPVLRRVEAVAAAPRRAAEVPDPQELRRRAYAALRELLARLGDRRPLVLAIDDLQWGDTDSLAVLSEILRPPDPPSLLLLACYRSEDAGEPVPPRRARPARRRRPRPPRPGRRPALARRVARAGPPTPGGDRPGRRAAGRGRRAGVGGQPALRRRAGALGRGRVGAGRARRGALVAGRPPARRRAAAAGGRGRLGRPGPARGRLAVPRPGRRRARAARPAADRPADPRARAGRRTCDRVETYHDRVRETVVAHLAARRAERLPPPPRPGPGGHRRRPTTRSSASTSAGRASAAGRAPTSPLAAAQAAEALAFDRASALYRLALELVPPGPAEARRLRAALAEALANAGRGAEAAREYLAACDGATVAEALELRRRAAMQFLISGHIDEGLDALRDVLAAIGMTLPRTPRRALASLLWRRALLRLRGLGFRPRDASEVAAGRPDPDRRLLVGRGRPEQRRLDPRGRLPGPRPAPGPARGRAVPGRPRPGRRGRPERHDRPVGRGPDRRACSSRPGRSSVRPASPTGWAW